MKNQVTHITTLLAACIFVMSGFAQADDRFSADSGNTTNANSSMGQTAVTVRHELIEDERQAIQAEIDALRAQLNALKAASNQGDAEVDQAITNVGKGEFASYPAQPGTCKDGEVYVPARSSCLYLR